MSKKKLGMASIEVNKKFANEKEANRYAKNLISAIRYICQRKADKGWFVQAMVVSSNLMKGVSLLEYERTGKRGRPRKVLRISERVANDWYKGNYITDWHLHILIVAKPIYAFRDAIKDYIDKNWSKVSILNEASKFDTIKFEILKVYKKDCNIKMADYFYNITKEERIKEEKKHMKKVQLNKIAENYNKVQNISHRRIDNNSIFEKGGEGYCSQK